MRGLHSQIIIKIQNKGKKSLNSLLCMMRGWFYRPITSNLITRTLLEIWQKIIKLQPPIRAFFASPSNH